MTKKTEKQKEKQRELNDKIYYAKDNLRRYFLKDLLMRKTCLKNVTLEQLDQLVYSINTLVSNLESNFENGELKLDIHDKDNWEGGGKFRDIILHNALDIPITYGGSTKDFKHMLEKRWAEKPNQAKEMLDELED